ncbi:MAG: hypothetical protein HY689_00280 [Chloroflexi bacterium]|nr:hypothetical protein [Chloroflexota bacterium]
MAVEFAVQVRFHRSQRRWQAGCPALDLRSYGGTPGEALAELGRKLDREMVVRFVAAQETREPTEGSEVRER